jgi:type IV pilus assembly protein PilW
MVTLLLSMILCSGIFFMMVGQKRTAQAQMVNITMQENAWLVMEHLQREIVKAGMGLGRCPQGDIQQWTGSGSNTFPAVFRSLRVYNSFNIYTTNPATYSTAPNANPTAPDSFTVAYNNVEDEAFVSIKVAAPHPAQSSVIWVNSPWGFKPDDLVVLWDPSQPTTPCFLLEVTGVSKDNGNSNKYKLQVNPGQGKGYNPPGGIKQDIFPPGGFGVGSIALNLTPESRHVRHYAIDQSTSVPRLVTWETENRNPSADRSNLEIVAEGVEDMQLAWACDRDGNGIFDEGVAGANPSARQNDEWMGNIAGDIMPVCGNQPIGQVRINLILRSPSADLRFKEGFRPQTEDRPAGTKAEDLAATGNLGTYSRRVLKAAVLPINMMGSMP